MNPFAKLEFGSRGPLTALLGLAFDGNRLDGVVVRRQNGSLQVAQSFTATLALVAPPFPEAPPGLVPPPLPVEPPVPVAPRASCSPVPVVATGRCRWSRWSCREGRRMQRIY